VQGQAIGAPLLGLLRGPADERLIIDKTGLTKSYDFTLEFDWRQPGVDVLDDKPSLSIFQALEQQLGLRLVDAKVPLDFVVIDHADRAPSEN
jgi:uncharacterized protein (TIGR03435 family)